MSKEAYHKLEDLRNQSQSKKDAENEIFFGKGKRRISDKTIKKMEAVIERLCSNFKPNNDFLIETNDPYMRDLYDSFNKNIVRKRSKFDPLHNDYYSDIT